MGSVPPLLSFLLMIAAGWAHRHQLIAYCPETRTMRPSATGQARAGSSPVREANSLTPANHPHLGLPGLGDARARQSARASHAALHYCRTVRLRVFRRASDANYLIRKRFWVGLRPPQPSLSKSTAYA
jgi:hypothetical protein